eukprot:TRINITY_DN28566_c0_g1_i1.p1 TRINITY_DN28566_c0_g1~~TRINITY_DN28566_c0_g1_i1.p1  ORF type:complete len:807 (-),score=153.62 TRINITY_DN28566_c0_g1_i1:88-2475(-)
MGEKEKSEKSKSGGGGRPKQNRQDKQDNQSRPRWRQGNKRDTFPWINGQIIQVSESGSLSDLTTCIEAHLYSMNLVNISTAFHRLAKLWTSDSPPQAVLSAERVLEGLTKQANAVLARASASGTAPSAQALANIAWAMATLHVMDEPLLNAMSGPAMTQVKQFKAFELSTILWSYAKMSQANAQACMCAGPLFAAAATHIPEKTEEFTFRCLVTVIWAFAAFRHNDAGLFQRIGAQLVGMVHTASCTELSNTAWSFGMAQVSHDRLFQELAKRANARLHEFKQQELSNMIWGFAANGFYQPTFCSNSVVAAQRLELTPQSIANILWALTRKKPKHSNMLAGVLALLPIACKQVDRFSVTEMAVTAVAAVKASRYSEGSRSNAGAVPSSLVSEFCTAAMQHALSKLKELSGLHLVSFAASFLLVQAPGAVVMLAAVGREALDRLQVLDNTVLLHLIRVFSVDLGAMQPPPLLEGACQGMFRALFAEAARRMETMKLKEMQILSKLCAEPFGLQSTDNMSAGELRSCCFALATTGGTAHRPLSLLDELLAEDVEVFWVPAPPEPAPVRASISLESLATPNLNLIGANLPPGFPASTAVRGNPDMSRFLQSGLDTGLAQAWVPSVQPQSLQMRPPFAAGGYPSDQAVPSSPPRAAMPGMDERTTPSPSKLPDYKPVCSVKNTFLHVSDSEEEAGDEGASPPWVSEDTLGPPLQFLPKDIELNELQAYRADYMKFRAGQATGARGEIGDVPEVALASESTIGALGLVESSEGQIRRVADNPAGEWAFPMQAQFTHHGGT